MSNNLEQAENVETLFVEIEKLKAEKAHEKALKEALEEEYQLLNYQFEEAIKYIKILRKERSSSNTGCVLVFIVVVVLVILFFLLMNSSASVVSS